jgi:AcrR family transcriptional regulator
MSKASARERLAQAAFDLFDERGYEQTTVDDITERAGLGRTTFFRYYRSKEDVIFPDHDLMLKQLKDRLAAAGHGTALIAVSDALRLVMLHYIDEGDAARRRYNLTSTVPALRDREIASVARYQRLFREFIGAWMGEATELASLRAEVMAAAVVAAHNHVLRRWLRGEGEDPIRELDDAMSQVITQFAAPAAPLGGPLAAPLTVTSAAGSATIAAPSQGDGTGTAIVAFRTSQDLQTLISTLRHVIDAPPDAQSTMLDETPGESTAGS